MAKVTIGGNEYEIAPLNFKAIKRIWPLVSQLENFSDPSVDNGLAAADVVIQVLAAAFERHNPEITADWIEENLSATELPQLQVTMQDIMVESGFITRPGETPTGEAQGRRKRSTATSTE